MVINCEKRSYYELLILIFNINVYQEVYYYSRCTLNFPWQAYHYCSCKRQINGTAEFSALSTHTLKLNEL